MDTLQLAVRGGRGSGEERRGGEERGEVKIKSIRE